MSESALSGRPYFSGEIPARVGGGLGGFLKWKKGGKEKKKKSLDSFRHYREVIEKEKEKKKKKKR